VPRDITFPETEPRYDCNRDSLAFDVRVDGKSAVCLVSGEFLMQHFGAREFEESVFQETFAAHRVEIQEIARNHIENGWLDERGCLFLNTRYTRLTVTFGGRLAEWSEGRALAEKAHRILLEIIGPDAETVHVEWITENRTPDDPLIGVMILNPSTPPPMRVLFHLKDFNNPTALKVDLAFLWNTVLRMRSRDLALK